MIFAELRGKLGPNAANADDRSEDLLTSTVFGLLRYISPNEGLLAILRKAKRLELCGNSLAALHREAWLDTPRVDSFNIEFWPTIGERSEPDILIRLKDSAGVLVHLILIEVKLWSPKSGGPVETDDDTEEGARQIVGDSDQLVKYWRGLQRIKGDAAASLVYLTPHITPPFSELKESIELCPEMHIEYLSWADVWLALRECNAMNHQLVNDDLLHLLRHKGLSYFEGFSLDSVANCASSFWRRRRWFEAAEHIQPMTAPTLFQQGRAS